MVQRVSIWVYSMLFSWFSWRHRIYLLMLVCLLLVTTSFSGMSEEVRRFDHNNDGKPDQWEHYWDGMLLRVEVDRNRDGRVDEWTFYEDGKPVRAEFDTTGNGQVNQRLFYDTDGQVIRTEYDQHAKGRPDQWEYFTPGSKEPYRVDQIPIGTARQTRCGRKVHQHRRNHAEGRRRHLYTAVGPDYRLEGTCLSEVISL